MYETLVEVENNLAHKRDMLMKPYVYTGLARLKRRRTSNSTYVWQLLKKKVISKNCLYQLLSEINSPPKETYAYTQWLKRE